MTFFAGIIGFGLGLYFGPALREAWANWRDQMKDDDDGDFGA